MPNQDANRVEIKKSRSKKKPFSVRHIGENGEQLGNPQLLTTKRNCIKNILAYLKLFHGTKVIVVVTLGRDVEKFWLYADGLQDEVS